MPKVSAPTVTAPSNVIVSVVLFDWVNRAPKPLAFGTAAVLQFVGVCQLPLAPIQFAEVMVTTRSTWFEVYDTESPKGALTVAKVPV